MCAGFGRESAPRSESDNIVRIRQQADAHANTARESNPLRGIPRNPAETASFASKVTSDTRHAVRLRTR